MRLVPQIKFVASGPDKAPEIHIYEDIGESFDWYTWLPSGITYESVSQQLDDIAEQGFKSVTVRINCLGGDVHQGIAIFNLFQRSDLDINIVVDGVAYSMAADLLQSAKKGKRSAAKNALIMVHSTSTGCYGYYNAQELLQLADAVTKYDQSRIQNYTEKTGLSEAELTAKWFDGVDHYMTAAEAKAAGLIDEILDYTALDVPSGRAYGDAVKQRIAARQSTESSGFMATIEKLVKKALAKSTKKEPMSLEKLKAATGKDITFTASDVESLLNDINAITAKTHSKEDVDTAVASATKPLNDRISELEQKLALSPAAGAGAAAAATEADAMAQASAGKKTSASEKLLQAAGMDMNGIKFNN